MARGEKMEGRREQQKRHERERAAVQGRKGAGTFVVHQATASANKQNSSRRGHISERGRIERSYCHPVPVQVWSAGAVVLKYCQGPA